MASPVSTPTITFSEFDLSTVNPVYSYDTLLPGGEVFEISFTGEIVHDSSNSTSPSIGANTSFMGPVTLEFNSPVSAVTLSAGVFDALGSTRVVLEGRNGFLVKKVLNSTTFGGYETFSFDFGENAITKVRLVPIGDEPAGFAVDNVSVSLLPESKDAKLSGQFPADYLIAGKMWAEKTITYSFIKASSEFPGYGTGPKTFDQSDVRVNTATPLSAAQEAGAVLAFQHWQSVCGLNFQEVNDTRAAGPGMIRLGVAGISDPADGGYPGQHPEAGDIWVQTGTAVQPTLGTYDFYVFLHEAGHALGLKHPHDSGLGSVMPANRDSFEYSIMSYRPYAGRDVGLALNLGVDSYPTTLMMNDIAAIQHLYGANFATHAGNDTYRFDPAQAKIFQTIWDGNGNDTYDFSAYATDLRISLIPGRWSVLSPSQLALLENSAVDPVHARGSVFNALLYKDNERSLIENALGGSGSDRITGNLGANRLEGRGGDDLLDGLQRGDRLLGGNGDDRLFGGSGSDRLVGGRGKDELTGGPGDDQFVYQALLDSTTRVRDRITDFIQGEDRINLAAIDADATTPGKQAFSFIGFAPFTGAGQLNFVQNGAVTLVSVNVDADLFSDLKVTVQSLISFTLADFVLT